MTHQEPILATINTLRAGLFVVTLAKIFGKKHVTTDSGCTVTMHTWRGISYLTGCKHD